MFFMELAVVRSVVGVRVTEGFDMFRRSMDDQIKVFLFIRGA
jgi:hypothetical protein